MVWLIKIPVMKKSVVILSLSVLFAWPVGIYSGWADTQKPLVVQSNYMDTVKAKQQKKKKSEPQNKTVTMSALDAVKVAGKLVDAGDYDQATRILTMMPQTNSLPVEIERWFLIAQMAQRQGDLDTAIKIYRKILDDQPDLVKIRYELALCYMAKKQWYRADYHLRLAMAGQDIPPRVKQQMMYYRWIARQNKNWNVWFNFGAGPDNNVNQTSDEPVCGSMVCTSSGWCIIPPESVCPYPKPEKAMGYHLMLGGNYEFRFGEHWRWKNDANIYVNTYTKYDSWDLGLFRMPALKIPTGSKYDDLYLSASTGPRYVWSHGDVWLAAVGARRWYGWDRYYWSAGGKIDTNYDFTRRLSAGLSLQVMDNKYDDDYYSTVLNGQTYSSNLRLSYSLDATKYIILRGGVDRDTTKSRGWSDWRYSTGIGFGSELPWGFNVYIEPSFIWTNYDEPRWFMVSENDVIFQKSITERDFMHRYALSLSNNKLDIWGFVPTMTFSYTNRDSNVKNRKYDKWALEFSMQQRF